MPKPNGDFVVFVLDQLLGLPDVSAQAMFGGYGLYQAGTFFGIIHQSRLYLKTDDQSRQDYLAAGMGPFRPNARQTLGAYYEVPVDVLEDAQNMMRWAKRALQIPRRS